MNASPDVTVSVAYIVQLRNEVSNLRGRLYMVRQALDGSDGMTPTNATHNTFWGGVDAMRDSVDDAMTREPVEREPITRSGAETYFETMRSMYGSDKILMETVDRVESRMKDDNTNPGLGQHTGGSARLRRRSRMWFNRRNE